MRGMTAINDRERHKMTIRVAINGFGRIGRNVLRAIAESGRTDIEVVGINDLGPVETNAHLLRFDSVHGRFPGTVTVKGDTISIGNGAIKVTAIKDPATLPWKELNVDIALECTGIFTAKDKASLHLTAGAKRVLVSAPAEGADLTVVYGVNHDKLTKDHKVVSNASCTTNCLAPVAKVLNDAVGIEHGFMTTIHAYTGDQPTLDTMHLGGAVDDPDLDRRRQGRRLGAAGVERQAGRRRHPRADAERVDDRLQVRRQTRDQQG
jgi:glyceraldehyde 3-phosphate dehydrogenase